MGQNGSVLVVEDDPGIRQVIALALEGEGFRVITTGNGREALAQLAIDLPVVMLLDLQMPVLDGWGVLRELAAIQSTVPVVLMSAGQRAYQEAERYSTAGYLTKPFDLDELTAVIAPFAANAA